MHSLIYLSSASSIYSEEQLTDILTISRKNNSKRGITGLLLYHDGSILQILEGEKQELNKLYEKIKLDRRHKNVLKIVDNPISERSFEEWSMGFKQVSAQDWAKLDGSLNLDDKKDLQQITNLKSANTIEMIKSFGNVTRLAI